MLRHTLERQSHVVLEARDQPEAVRMLQTMQPAVVLSDLRLPEGDGFGVLRAAAISMNVFCKTQIALGRKSRKKVESLKNEANLAPSDISTLRIAHSRQVLAVYDDAPRRRLEQTAQNVKQT